MNEHLSSMLHRYGIKHETTVPYSPQQNGVAERLNRTLVERARTTLIESHSSPDLWAEVIATAVYLNNRSPTKALSDITPQEARSEHKPDLRHLRIFDSRRKKWDAKSQELIFVGYCEESKGYRLVHPVTKKLTRSRDVSFFEHEFLASGASAADPFPVNPDVNGVSQFSSNDSLQHSTLQQTYVEVGESKLTSGDSRDPVLQTTVEAYDETDNQSAVHDDMSATSGDSSEITEDRPKRVHIPTREYLTMTMWLVRHSCTPVIQRRLKKHLILQMLQIGRESWKKRFRRMQKMVLGHCLIYRLEEKRSNVNGCSKLSLMPMDILRDVKLGLLLKAVHSSQASTTKRLTHLLFATLPLDS